MKILAVDDNRDNVELICQILEAEYDVIRAYSGEDAIKLAKEQQPNLILLDVMMPKMDGFQVCSAVRADADLADVRIIMLTAKGREAEVEKGLSLGADAYIPKPFSTSELVSRVNALLESKE